jgi:hypothetical protein
MRAATKLKAYKLVDKVLAGEPLKKADHKFVSDHLHDCCHFLRAYRTAWAYRDMQAAFGLTEGIMVELRQRAELEKEKIV